jgi:hypothetical protein
LQTQWEALPSYDEFLLAIDRLAEEEDDTPGAIKFEIRSPVHDTGIDSESDHAKAIRTEFSAPAIALREYLCST